jgi:hypothetical protein
MECAGGEFSIRRRSDKALEKVAALKKVAQIQRSVKERAADTRVELLSHQPALSPAEF